MLVFRSEIHERVVCGPFGLLNWRTRAFGKI